MEPTKGRRMLWAGDGQRRQRMEKSQHRGREKPSGWGAAPPHHALFSRPQRGGLACSASKVSRETVDHPRQLKLREAVQRVSKCRKESISRLSSI